MSLPRKLCRGRLLLSMACLVSGSALLVSGGGLSVIAGPAGHPDVRGTYRGILVGWADVTNHDLLGPTRRYPTQLTISGQRSQKLWGDVQFDKDLQSLSFDVSGEFESPNFDTFALSGTGSGPGPWPYSVTMWCLPDAPIMYALSTGIYQGRVLTDNPAGRLLRMFDFNKKDPPPWLGQQWQGDYTSERRDGPGSIDMRITQELHRRTPGTAFTGTLRFDPNSELERQFLVVGTVNSDGQVILIGNSKSGDLTMEGQVRVPGGTELPYVEATYQLTFPDGRDSGTANMIIAII